MNENTNKSVYIRCCFCKDEEEFEGTILSKATGFFVEENNEIFLITNRHIVTGKDNFTGEILDANAARPNYLLVEFPYIVKRKNNNDKFWSNPFKIPLYKNNNVIDDEKLWMEHPRLGEKIDVVAINVTEICNNSINALKTIGNCSYADIPRYKNIYSSHNHVPYITQQIYVVGYPFGYSTTFIRYLPIWSVGIIASEYEEDLYVPIDLIEKGEAYQAPSFLIDCKTRSGQSGSPVISYKICKGKEETTLLGVYSGRVNEKSDLGYVWKTQVIYEIINKIY